MRRLVWTQAYVFGGIVSAAAVLLNGCGPQPQSVARVAQAPQQPPAPPFSQPPGADSDHETPQLAPACPTPYAPIGALPHLRLARPGAPAQAIQEIDALSELPSGTLHYRGSQLYVEREASPGTERSRLHLQHLDLETQSATVICSELAENDTRPAWSAAFPWTIKTRSGAESQILRWVTIEALLRTRDPSKPYRYERGMAASSASFAQADDEGATKWFQIDATTYELHARVEHQGAVGTAVFHYRMELDAPPLAALPEHPVDEILDTVPQKPEARAEPAGQVRGKHSDGALVNASPLPEEGEGFVHLFRKRQRQYGSQGLVEILIDAAAEMARRYPGKERLQIGDLSARRGGEVSRHGSHENGLDVDLVYYRNNLREQTAAHGNGGFIENFVRGGQITPNLDVERNWELVKLFAATGRMSRVFVHPAIKRAFCAQASDNGELKEQADTLRRIQLLENHGNHLHLRITCPASSPGCVQQKAPRGRTGC
jgi:penicillin-insensitive murein endopeptidase